MDLIRVYGGLGNQLFQYAFGKVIASNGIEVKYDLTYRKKVHANEDYREYALNKFHTKVNIGLWRKQILVRERDFFPDLVKTDNCNIWGYWQRTYLYDDVLPVLRKEFCVKEELYTPKFLELKEQILSYPSISLHVRRGDYVRNHAFNVLPISYYKEALKQVPEGTVYIFSDDIPWCKDHFSSEHFHRKFVFVDIKDYLGLELMKLCDHNIIANSTYSWWAAYLNENEDKIVVAPKKWRERREDQDRFDRDFQLSKDWVRL